MGLVRSKYIAFVFGAGAQTDAYNAAFELPDIISYFLVGGVASISLVTMLNRYREAKDEQGGDRALVIVLNAMLIVLTIGIVVAEVLAPLYTHYKFPGFDPAKAAMCVKLTRIVLPAQLFFFAGGVLASKMLVRKVFLYQAITPLIYNAGIIAGGVFFAHRFGIYSLAIGVLAGVIVGPMGLNAWAALRSGLRWQPIFNLRHPAFLEWLKLSLPLMAGVSLVMADKWILTTFASYDSGGITRLTFAKTLFIAPMGILGQAAGAASLPFFAALYSQRKHTEFAAAVNRSSTRVMAASLLLAAWMAATATPLVDLLFRGGAFSPEAARATATYFVVFTLSIAAWTAQAIYARAFYAAGNTLTPAISGTIVTVLSIPVYYLLFHHIGLIGLAVASDIGITTHALVLATLLHRSKLARVTGLEWGELARSLAAAIASYAGIYALLRFVHLAHSHRNDVLLLALSSIVWLALCWAVLAITGSKLPKQLLSRGKAAA